MSVLDRSWTIDDLDPLGVEDRTTVAKTKWLERIQSLEQAGVDAAERQRCVDREVRYQVRWAKDVVCILRQAAAKVGQS